MRPVSETPADRLSRSRISKDHAMSDTIDGLRQFVVFRLHAREYALPVGQVVEVLHMVAMTPLPEAPAWLPGLIDLRGQVIPILDLRTRLGLRPQAPDLDTAIVVV